MIIYMFMTMVLWFLNTISLLFKGMIPNFPSTVSDLFVGFAETLSQGVSFISYFTYWDVIVCLISIILSYRIFLIVKDAIMKIFGLFIGN